jgi:predicted RNase H-like HicB family nuclease
VGEIIMSQKFTASLWQEGDWFVAQYLEVDIASQGETEEEALTNLQEASELYFEPPRPIQKPVIRQLEMELYAVA